MTGTRRTAVLLQASSFIDQYGWRIAQIALPVVAVRQTGSVSDAGIVAAAAGIPSFTAPWWARRPRLWAHSARRIAAVYALCGAVSAVLPLAAATHEMLPALLAVVGCAIGTLGTLATPSHSALIADLGDRMRTNGAARMLTWKDSGQRASMLLGPVTAAALIGACSPTVVLAADSVSYLLAASLLVCAGSPQRSRTLPTPQRSPRQPPAPGNIPAPAPRIRDTLTGHSEVCVGWLIRGTGCFGWFAFSLGLPLLGTGLAATAFAAYGAAGLLAAPAAAHASGTRRPARLAAAGWFCGGTAFVLLGAVPTRLGALAAGTLAGLTVPIGNAAVTAALTRAHNGEMRRTALAGQESVIAGASTAGLTIGATVIGALGPRTTLMVTGAAIAAVAVLANTLTPRAIRSPDAPPKQAPTPSHPALSDHLGTAQRGRERVAVPAGPRPYVGSGVGELDDVLVAVGDGAFQHAGRVELALADSRPLPGAGRLGGCVRGRDGGRGQPGRVQARDPQLLGERGKGA
jgi:MFS family permease